MYRKILNRLHQAEWIGLNDENNNPIREGDILCADSGFCYIVIWNEFINNFAMYFVSCFKDMIIHPHTRETYMADSNPICSQFIDFWHLKVTGNIDKRPYMLNESSLL